MASIMTQSDLKPIPRPTGIGRGDIQASRQKREIGEWSKVSFEFAKEVQMNVGRFDPFKRRLILPQEGMDLSKAEPGPPIFGRFL